MVQSVEEIVREYLQAARKMRRENRDPAKAKAFLLRAGIAERHKASPNGIRLAKRYR